MIRYLSGVTSDAIEQGLGGASSIGLMLQPGNYYHHRLGKYPFWAADNGVFTRNAKGFSAKLFRRMLGREQLRAHAGRCLFVVAPDRLDLLSDGSVRGDPIGTLERFPEWSDEIRAAGFPVALVAQTGLENMLREVPWGLCDALFVGGSTEWKLSDAAHACVVEARRRGKHTHMGRVNSFRRLAIASEMLCDSADGTFLRFAPRENVSRLARMLEQTEQGVQARLPWGHG